MKDAAILGVGMSFKKVHRYVELKVRSPGFVGSRALVHQVEIIRWIERLEAFGFTWLDENRSHGNSRWV